MGGVNEDFFNNFIGNNDFNITYTCSISSNWLLQL